jgi:apolipoprotein N-acyltransferase
MPSGRIARSLGLFERGTLTAPIPLRAGTTVYTRLGDWVAWLSLAVTASGLAAAWRWPAARVHA